MSHETVDDHRAELARARSHRVQAATPTIALPDCRTRLGDWQRRTALRPDRIAGLSSWAKIVARGQRTFPVRGSGRRLAADRQRLRPLAPAAPSVTGRGEKPLPYQIPRKSSFLAAPAPESDFVHDRKKQGQRCTQAINKCSFLSG